MQYSGHPPIHPQYIQQLQAQISEAHAELKRGIDADWRASVLRYPEVLDYFYSLIDLRVPSERSREVIEPPFAAAGYVDRGYESRVVVKDVKKKKRRDREQSIGAVERRHEPGTHAVVHRIMRAPPQVPTPPIQPGSGGYQRPPPSVYYP
jgi:hypothetical protein